MDFSEIIKTGNGEGKEKHVQPIKIDNIPKEGMDVVCISTGNEAKHSLVSEQYLEMHRQNLLKAEAIREYFENSDRKFEYLNYEHYIEEYFVNIIK